MNSDDARLISKFLTEVWPAVPQPVRQMLKNLKQGKQIPAPEIESARQAFTFVFDSSVRALNRIFGWTGIAKWKRQLLFPALWEWYTWRKGQYETKREQLSAIRRAWKEIEGALIAVEETNVSEINTREHQEK